MSAVKLNEVHKRYGTTPALSGMTFHVPRNTICGLVGPNGAGKTTIMGLLGGLLKHQSGTVDVLGLGAFSAKEHAGKVGLMPQDSAPSPHVSLQRILEYYAVLQGLPSHHVRAEVARRLDEVQLGARAGARYRELSHGMRRRFSIAQALLGSPELILLDEPTSGLDPELVVQTRELIAAQRGTATVLVSSHVLGELENLCDYVVFVDGGRCVRHGTLREVTAAENTVRYVLAQAPDLERLGVALQACSLEWNAPTLLVRAPTSQSVEETNRLCLRQLLDDGVGILRVEAGDSLEASYLKTRAQLQLRGVAV